MTKKGHARRESIRTEDSPASSSVRDRKNALNGERENGKKRRKREKRKRGEEHRWKKKKKGKGTSLAA